MHFYFQSHKLQGEAYKKMEWHKKKSTLGFVFFFSLKERTFH